VVGRRQVDRVWTPMLSGILGMLLKLSIALLSTKNVSMEIVAWSLDYSSAYADVINRYLFGYVTFMCRGWLSGERWCCRFHESGASLEELVSRDLCPKNPKSPRSPRDIITN
jgi:hypothetical protein